MQKWKWCPVVVVSVVDFVGNASCTSVNVRISVMHLSPRILRKDVFYSQNVMPFKRVNRRFTLLTKEVVQCLSCQLCSDLLWKVIRYVLQKMIFFFPVFYRDIVFKRAVILLPSK